MAKLGERKGSCAGKSRGFWTDILGVGINEFLNKFLCVNPIRLSREKVALTFAALNVRHVLQEEMGNVNCSAKMLRVGINIEPVLMLTLWNVSLSRRTSSGYIY